MRPNWIEIDDFPYCGVGVTALSEKDALAFLERAYGNSYRIISTKVISDAQELDQNHVVPNMGNMLARGIWFPLGYEHLSKETNA
ncbi:MAG: hypothetical protein ACRED5_03230 [Propylenella sp.]